MDYAAARDNMIQHQIRVAGIADESLLRALGATQRELYVPEKYRRLAYSAAPIPLGEERYMMPPLSLMRLLEAAKPTSGDVVLNVGCGFGYAAALMSRMVSMVIAIETSPWFVERATRIFAKQAIDTVVVLEGSLTTGLADQGPYDIILVEGMVRHIPERLCRQLAPAGRLVCVQEENGGGRTCCITRSGKGFLRTCGGKADAPLIPAFDMPRPFAFP